MGDATALLFDLPESLVVSVELTPLWLRVTNARTEGGNPIIKQLKRVGCGYRNQGNYQRRILLHIAAKNAA